MTWRVGGPIEGISSTIPSKSRPVLGNSSASNSIANAVRIYGGKKHNEKRISSAKNWSRAHRLLVVALQLPPGRRLCELVEERSRRERLRKAWVKWGNLPVRERLQTPIQRNEQEIVENHNTIESPIQSENEFDVESEKSVISTEALPTMITTYDTFIDTSCIEETTQVGVPYEESTEEQSKVIEDTIDSSIKVPSIIISDTEAAIRIQCAIRCYFARYQTAIRLRTIVIRFLREWTQSCAVDILRLPEFQSLSHQVTLQYAINALFSSTIPYKDSPSLSTIRHIHQSIMNLWNSHLLNRLTGEKIKRSNENRMMRNEDARSSRIEMYLREKQWINKLEKERQQNIDDLEKENHRQYSAVLSALRGREEIRRQEREEKEKKWREVKTKIWEAEARENHLLRLLQSERENMIWEDHRTRLAIKFSFEEEMKALEKAKEWKAVKAVKAEKYLKDIEKLWRQNIDKDDKEGSSIRAYQQLRKKVRSIWHEPILEEVICEMSHTQSEMAKFALNALRNIPWKKSIELMEGVPMMIYDSLVGLTHPETYFRSYTVRDMVSQPRDSGSSDSVTSPGAAEFFKHGLYSFMELHTFSIRSAWVTLQRRQWILKWLTSPDRLLTMSNLPEASAMWLSKERVIHTVAFAYLAYLRSSSPSTTKWHLWERFSMKDILAHVSLPTVKVPNLRTQRYTPEMVKCHSTQSNRSKRKTRRSSSHTDNKMTQLQFSMESGSESADIGTQYGVLLSDTIAYAQFCQLRILEEIEVQSLNSLKLKMEEFQQCLESLHEVRRQLRYDKALAMRSQRQKALEKEKLFTNQLFDIRKSLLEVGLKLYGDVFALVVLHLQVFSHINSPTQRLIRWELSKDEVDAHRSESKLMSKVSDFIPPQQAHVKNVVVPLTNGVHAFFPATLHPLDVPPHTSHASVTHTALVPWEVADRGIYALLLDDNCLQRMPGKSKGVAENHKLSQSASQGSCVQKLETHVLDIFYHSLSISRTFTPLLCTSNTATSRSTKQTSKNVKASHGKRNNSSVDLPTASQPIAYWDDLESLSGLILNTGELLSLPSPPFPHATHTGWSAAPSMPRKPIQRMKSTSDIPQEAYYDPQDDVLMNGKYVQKSNYSSIGQTLSDKRNPFVPSDVNVPEEPSVHKTNPHLVVDPQSSQAADSSQLGTDIYTTSTPPAFTSILSPSELLWSQLDTSIEASGSVKPSQPSEKQNTANHLNRSQPPNRAETNASSRGSRAWHEANPAAYDFFLWLNALVNWVETIRQWRIRRESEWYRQAQSALEPILLRLLRESSIDVQQLKKGFLNNTRNRNTKVSSKFTQIFSQEDITGRDEWCWETDEIIEQKELTIVKHLMRSELSLTDAVELCFTQGGWMFSIMSQSIVSGETGSVGATPVKLWLGGKELREIFGGRMGASLLVTRQCLAMECCRMISSLEGTSSNSTLRNSVVKCTDGFKILRQRIEEGFARLPITRTEGQTPFVPLLTESHLPNFDVLSTLLKSLERDARLLSSHLTRLTNWLCLDTISPSKIVTTHGAWLNYHPAPFEKIPLPEYPPPSTTELNNIVAISLRQRTVYIGKIFMKDIHQYSQNIFWNNVVKLPQLPCDISAVRVLKTKLGFGEIPVRSCAWVYPVAKKLPVENDRDVLVTIENQTDTQTVDEDIELALDNFARQLITIVRLRALFAPLVRFLLQSAVYQSLEAIPTPATLPLPITFPLILPDLDIEREEYATFVDDSLGITRLSIGYGDSSRGVTRRSWFRGASSKRSSVRSSAKHTFSRIPSRQGLQQSRFPSSRASSSNNMALFTRNSSGHVIRSLHFTSHSNVSSMKETHQLKSVEVIDTSCGSSCWSWFTECIPCLRRPAQVYAESESSVGSNRLHALEALRRHALKKEQQNLMNISRRKRRRREQIQTSLLVSHMLSVHARAPSQCPMFLHLVNLVFNPSSVDHEESIDTFAFSHGSSTANDNRNGEEMVSALLRGLSREVAHIKTHVRGLQRVESWTRTPERVAEMSDPMRGIGRNLRPQKS